MSLVYAKCTNCGAPLEVDNSKKAAICPYSDLLPDRALNLVENTTFKNHNWRKVYSFAEATYKNLLAIVDSLRAQYGEIEDILCIWLQEGTNNLASYEDYDCFEEFCSNFTESKFYSSHILQFCCIHRHVDFRILRREKVVEIKSNEGSLGIKCFDPSQVFYYRDDYGNLVRFDKNKMMVYDYDREKRKWIESRWRWPDFCNREDNNYEQVQLSLTELLRYTDGNELGE